MGTESAGALWLKGWLDSDTKAFAAVRGQLSAKDEKLETAKGVANDATVQRERRALDFYHRLLTIQNTAEVQWPKENPANAGVREEFRLNTFPPRVGVAAGQPPSSPSPSPTPLAK